MSLQACRCGQQFVHVPLPGAARDSECLFCYLPGCDSGNGAGTSAEVAIASSNEAANGPNVENPTAAGTAMGQVASKGVPTMATILETRKVRVRVPARSARIGQVAL